MEGDSSRSEIHTPVFDKKKKKHSVCKERHRRHSHENSRDSPLASEHSHKTKKKKKRKEFQQIVSSPLKTSEICDEAEKATCTVKKKKKRRNSALGVPDETGGVYVMMDKENIESRPENFRRDVDVIYVDMSKGQKSTREPKAEEAHSAPKRHEKESEALHNKIKEKP